MTVPSVVIITVGPIIMEIMIVNNPVPKEIVHGVVLDRVVVPILNKVVLLDQLGDVAAVAVVDTIMIEIMTIVVGPV